MIERINENVFAIRDEDSYIDIPFYFLKHKQGNVLIGVSNNFKDSLVKEILKLGSVSYLFVTHFHPDFPIEVCKYKMALKAKLIMHEKEAKLLTCKVEKPFINNFMLYDDVEILYTPGHTIGNSVLFYAGNHGVLFSGDCICVDKNGNPVMLKYYVPPKPLTIAEKTRIMSKLKIRDWNTMLSHWGMIRDKAGKRFFEIYS